MDMIRVTARWAGFPGAPGYSNFFFAGGGGFISDAQQVANRVGDALGNLRNVLAPDSTVRVESEVAILDSDTGMIDDYQQIEPPETVVAMTSGNFAGPAGGVVNWRTADLRNGRRIRGRTFIVPLVSTAFDNSGTLSSAGLNGLNGFAEAMIGGDLDSEFGVWSRPVGGSGGVFATVNGHSVPDKAAVLRSRRD